MPTVACSKPLLPTFPANYTQGSTVAANPTGQACDPPSSISQMCLAKMPVDLTMFRLSTSFLHNSRHFALAKRSNRPRWKSYSFSRVCKVAQRSGNVYFATPLGGLSMSPASPFYPGNGITPANPDLDTTLPISLGWRTSLVGGRASFPENDTDRFLISLDGSLG